jgi:hypothetical protein
MAKSNEQIDVEKENAKWRKRFEDLEVCIKNQADQTSTIHKCLVGDPLKGEDGLVQVVKNLALESKQARIQRSEFALRITEAEKDIAYTKTQRKTLLGLLTLMSGGLGAMVTKFFATNAAEEAAKHINK